MEQCSLICVYPLAWLKCLQKENLSILLKPFLIIPWINSSDIFLRIHILGISNHRFLFPFYLLVFLSCLLWCEKMSVCGKVEGFATSVWSRSELEEKLWIMSVHFLLPLYNLLTSLCVRKQGLFFRIWKGSVNHQYCNSCYTITLPSRSGMIPFSCSCAFASNYETCRDLNSQGK